jgi:hypothetical protein
MDRDKNIIATFVPRPPNPDDLKSVNPDEVLDGSAETESSKEP